MLSFRGPILPCIPISCISVFFVYQSFVCVHAVIMKVHRGKVAHTGTTVALICSLAHPTVPPTWQQDTDSLIPKSISYLTAPMWFISSTWISCDHHPCFFKIAAFVSLLFIIHISRRCVSAPVSQRLACIHGNDRLLHCFVRPSRLNTEALTCVISAIVSSCGGCECWPWRGVLSPREAWPTPRQPFYEWTDPWAAC